MGQDSRAHPGNPPPDRLLELVVGFQLSQAVYVVAKLGIADLLTDGPKSAEELARASGTHPPSLFRMLRVLSSVGVFAQDAAGCFSLTPLSRALQTDHPTSMRAYAMFQGEAWLWRGWDLLHTVTTGEPGFHHAYGMSYCDYLAEHPDVGGLFNAAMAARLPERYASVAAAYDFGDIGSVVDVGGGRGSQLAAILAAHPTTRGILFDRPDVVAGASTVLQAAGVSDRCSIVGGDFFVEVPAGGDAYLLSAVIHNWDDERAVAILVNCRRALGTGGKLLLVERVISTDTTDTESLLVDLRMLVLFGGRERTEAEFRALYAAAGFELTTILPTASPYSVIEGVPR